MRPDIPHRNGGAGGDFPLHPQRPRHQRRRLQIRLDPAGHQLRAGRNRRALHDGQLRHGKIRHAVGRVERRVLIGAIAQRVLQVVVHSEARADHRGALLSERIPRHSESRLRQEFPVIRREGGVADVRLGQQDAVGKGISGSASVRLVPAGSELVAEAQREREARGHANRVLGVARAKPRPPAEQRGRRIVQQAAHRALQERLQTGKGRLSILAERQILVRPQPLEPAAHGELVAAFGERDAVFVGEQVSRHAQIAAVVAAREAQLRRGIRRRAAANYQRAKRQSRQKTGKAGGGRAWRGLAGEEIAGARESYPHGVYRDRGKNPRFFQAGHLLAQALDVGAVGIRAGRREAGAVVHGVDCVQRVSIGELMVQPEGTEVVADGL